MAHIQAQDRSQAGNILRKRTSPRGDWFSLPSSGQLRSASFDQEEYRNPVEQEGIRPPRSSRTARRSLVPGCCARCVRISR